MAQTLTLKQGDSFERLLPIPDSFVDGYFTDWVASSQLRSTEDGSVIAEFDVAWADPVTTRVLRLTEIDTTLWPLGTAEFDVQFKRVSDGFVLSTSTAKLKVTKDVTSP